MNKAIIILEENFERVLQLLSENKIVQALSILKEIVSIAKSTNTISDKILAQKVFAFLSPMENLCEDDRNLVIRNYVESEENKEKIGQLVLFHLNSTVNLKKAKLLGFLFLKFIYKNASFDELELAYEVVQRSFYKDIKNFFENRTLSNAPESTDYYQNLISVGLTRPIMAITIDPPKEMQYERTEIGDSLIKMLSGFSFED